MGPNNWGIFLILLVTTGEGIGPAGEISPVVCMLKNGLPRLDCTGATSDQGHRKHLKSGGGPDQKRGT